MIHIDGHELAIVSMCTGIYGVTQGIYGSGWVKSLIHRQPIVAMSFFLAGVGIALPIVVPPIRRKLGLPTNQYDASMPGTVFPKLQ